MNNLPKEFKIEMKNILKNEYEEFIQCYNKPHFRGIRLNTLKCDEKTLKSGLPFVIKPSSFSPLSYYVPENVRKIGTLPMHHAGAFYVQEPSASSAVTALNPMPGDVVLDLCAAPGGKSTQIASFLQGKGLLWSNEIVKNRANVLLSNIERLGIRNAVVSSCHPQVLCSALAGYFDKILVDAPCSGEGMFRRDEKAIENWSVEYVKSCAERQLAILNSASYALKENGLMVYSTCTFSTEENEGVVSAFLKEHDDFELIEIKSRFGCPAFLQKARRIFPMDCGEGHFVALMRRNSKNNEYPKPYSVQNSGSNDLVKKLYVDIFKNHIENPIEKIGSNYIIIPKILPTLKGLGVIRAGVLMGEEKKNRIEPAHALFMAANPENLNNVINLSHDSKTIYAFLRGEEIEVDENIKGFTGVAVDGVITGFGKCSNGKLKNRYPKGLRNFA